MGDIGGRKWLITMAIHTMKAFFRVRVGTVLEQENFEGHLKYNFGPEGEGRFKSNMKVFSTENM